MGARNNLASFLIHVDDRMIPERARRLVDPLGFVSHDFCCASNNSKHKFNNHDHNCNAVELRNENLGGLSQGLAESCLLPHGIGQAVGQDRAISCILPQAQVASEATRLKYVME